MRLFLERIWRDAVPCQRQTDLMAPKPWFQANIHAPGTGFALLVIAFCLLLQTIPSAICVLTPRTGWDPDVVSERRQVLLKNRTRVIDQLNSLFSHVDRYT